MALTKKRVDVGTDKTRSRNQLYVHPATSQITRLATIAAAGSPATVALTVAGVAGDRHVMDRVFLGSDTTDAKPLVHIAAGDRLIDHYVQGSGVIELNLETLAGTTGSVSLTGVQSVAHTVALTAHTIDE